MFSTVYVDCVFANGSRDGSHFVSRSRWKLGAINSYNRGDAYLKANQGSAAAAFQQIIDHPGLVRICFPGALAHLQLGRAQAMMGDKEAARSHTTTSWTPGKTPILPSQSSGRRKRKMQSSSSRLMGISFSTFNSKMHRWPLLDLDPCHGNCLTLAVRTKYQRLTVRQAAGRELRKCTGDVW